ncbi:MAG: ATP-binding protein [Deltaproteobacteria bacterium]|nr:ATP-binding protein [Deltaproteobacteria bacterium]
MWFPRHFSERLRDVALHFPAVVLTGARQVGKSSLLRREFPQHAYVSLDVPSTAELAERDPTAFFARHPPPVLVDEVQYAPGVFRAVKVLIDADRHAMGRFILTGSQRFALMNEVSESLAGRCAVLELDGLSAAELMGAGMDAASRFVEVLTRGSFPELWRDPEMPSDVFYASYLATYLERDVRQLLNVGSLRDFERFVRACAARSAQALNKSDLARDVGISPTTAGEWLSVLVTSGQVSLLEPWFTNVGKRLVKTPKLYLRDTGLLSWLLGLSASDFERSPYRGAVFETWVHGELHKRLADMPHVLTYYRDQQNREVDFVVDRGGRLALFEAKLTEQPSSRDAAGLETVAKLLRERSGPPLDVDLQALVSRPQTDHPLAGGQQVVHAARVSNLL